MTDHEKNRRRNYFIDKSFQTKFILKFCVLIILASLLTGTLIYYLNNRTTTVAFEKLKVVVKTTSDFILPIMFQVLVLVTIAAGVATVSIALFASHKIAGPIYRLKVEIKKIKEGDLSSYVHIRSDDQLQGLASECEELRLRLNVSIRGINNQWIKLKQELQLLSKTADNDTKKRVEDIARSIDSEISKFKIVQ